MKTSATLHDEFCGTPPTRGLLKIGEKKKEEKNPRKLGHFKFVTPTGEMINDLHHADVYGLTPKHIRFTLPYDTVSENLTVTFGAFGQQKSFTRCFGNGGKAFRMWRENVREVLPDLYPDFEKEFGLDDKGHLKTVIPCPGKACPVFKAGQCKVNGILPLFPLYPDNAAQAEKGRALRPYGGLISGCFKYWTTGKSTIKSLTFVLQQIYDWTARITGGEGFLAGIPLELIHDTGKSNGKKIPIVVPDFPGTTEEFVDLVLRLSKTPRMVYRNRSISDDIERLREIAEDEDEALESLGGEMFPTEGGHDGEDDDLDAAIRRDFMSPKGKEVAPPPVPPSALGVLPGDVEKLKTCPGFTPAASAPAPSAAKVVDPPPTAVAEALAEVRAEVREAAREMVEAHNQGAPAVVVAPPPAPAESPADPGKPAAGGFTLPTGPANPGPAFFTAPAPPVPPAAPEVVPPPSDPIPPPAEAAASALAALDSIASLDGDDPKVTQAALDAAKVAAAAEQKKRDADKARAEAEKESKPKRAPAKKPPAPPAIPSNLLES